MHFSKLPDNTIWLCAIKMDANADLNVLRNCAWLSLAEQQRNARFRFARDRSRDLMARWLMRKTLAEYTDQLPQSLLVERSDKGKPYLQNIPHTIPANTLHFNLSHTRDWVVMAVAKHSVGVDIEATARNNDVLAIANHYFFGAELKELHGFPAEQQAQRFFDYWTLKESYMKARGEGISLGLDNFGFQISDGQITLQMKPHLNDDPNSWQFVCETPVPNYRLALALRHHQPFEVIVERFWLDGGREYLPAARAFQWES